MLLSLTAAAGAGRLTAAKAVALTCPLSPSSVATQLSNALTVANSSARATNAPLRISHLPQH
eukprot:COSAG01_NODE_62521_length_284_cov_0.821622_1_plen_61_part_01